MIHHFRAIQRGRWTQDIKVVATVNIPHLKESRVYMQAEDAEGVEGRTRVPMFPKRT
jgi:hypothetical protein